MRGFRPPSACGQRALILLDGFRLNNPFYDGGNVDRTIPIDADEIDRNEFIHGPGSALYGTNAVLGVVNIITRRGRDLAGSEAAVTLGSHNTLGGRASWGTRLVNDLELLPAAGGRWSEGQDHSYEIFDGPITSHRSAEDLDAEWDVDTLAKIGFRELQLFWGQREKEIPTGSYETQFNGKRSFTNGINSGVSPSINQILSSGTEIHGAVQMQYYIYFGDCVYNWGEGDSVEFVTNHDESDSLSWGAESFVSEQIFNKNRLTAGFDVRHIVRINRYNVDLLPDPVENINSSDSTLNGVVYLQDEWRLLDAVSFTSCVRADKHPDFGLTVNPRMPLLINPTQTTTLKPHRGTAFRTPNGYERFYVDGGHFNKKPESLDPEKAETAKGIIEQGWTRRDPPLPRSTTPT